MIEKTSSTTPATPLKALPPGAPVEAAPAMQGDVRVVSYNTAVGASKIKTPQADFTKLPFYREALTNQPGAAILALQEVSHEQIEAARAFEKAGTCTVIVQRVSMNDQYNAIIVPKRYTVVESRSQHYVVAQAKAIGRAAWSFAKSLGRERTKLTDLIQPRGFLEAKLQDTRTGKTFQVFDTHMALNGRVRLDQASQLLGAAERAAKLGPVVIAGDLNVRTVETDRHSGGHDAAFRARLAGWADMGQATAGQRTLVGDPGNIDWVVAKGFTAVSSKIHTDILLSDHLAEDADLRFGDR